MRYLAFFLLGTVMGLAQEIPLQPVDPETLGTWAQVVRPLRLYPTLPRTVTYTGPELVTRLFGEITLGRAQYPLLLGVNAQNEVGLWVDFDGDGYLREPEKVSGEEINEGIVWSIVLHSEPPGATPFPYPLQVIWPMGRGYVFLVGGAPRLGFFQDRKIAVVDGDLDGAFGTKGDFLGVDVDGDGQIYAELDGHEHFSLFEAFTLNLESFKLQAIASDGQRIWVGRTAYVPPKEPLIPGSPAPNFVFRDFTSDRELSLQSFRGKVVLLDFWAAWCPPCMASLPRLRQIYEEFHPHGFEIVGVSLDESEEELRRVLKEQGITWPVVFLGKRWDNPIAVLYRVYQIPTTYLLDKNGVIRYRDLEGEALREALVELLWGGRAEAPAGEGPPILTLEVPKPIPLNAGSTLIYALKIRNPSNYVAQGVQVFVEGLPPGVHLRSPDPFDLPPHEEHTVPLELSAEVSATPGPSVPILLHLAYQYCPKDACFAVRQTAQTVVTVEGTQSGSSSSSAWWILAVLGVGALAILIFLSGSFFGTPLLVFLLGLAERMLWPC
ncbi:MAG: redoxin domain-containing protein [Candidatus Bipolaricaulaceae bacterium]